MQKKHFLLVVVSLALLSTAWFVSRSNMGSNFVGQMVGSSTMMDVDNVVTDGELGMVKQGGSPTVSTWVTEQLDVGGQARSGMAEPMIGIMPPYYYGDDALDVSQRSYEKYSYHSVVVDNVNTYMRGLKEYFMSIEGVVLNSSMNSSDKYESASLFVKVPVDKFDEATGRITEEVEKVIDESVSASDITGQVVSTQESVTALEEQKALKVAQLADAQTQLEKTRIQIEIDRLDRQIAAAKQAQESVETRTEYASVSITAASNEKYFNPGTTGDFEYELQRAWESLKSFLKVLLVFGIWVAVYSIVWAPIVWLVSKVTSRLRNNTY